MNIVIVVGLVVTLLTCIPVFLQLRNHPRGLKILFFAEMWERFSYYGMRGLLIFFLTQHFLLSDKDASSQYASYTTLVYLVPLIGGFLADRFLGTRKAILFGAVALVAGHFLMGFEGKPATQTLTYQGATYEFVSEGRAGDREVKLVVDGKQYAYGPSAEGGLEIKDLPVGAPIPTVLPKGQYELGTKPLDQIAPGITYKDVMFLALSLIILGVGFLKPNISTIVGQLYEEGDPRRDPGFTLYYYGINLGAFWAAILCGWLGQTVGWWAGFGLAGVGMLLGLVVFVLGKPLLEGRGEPPAPEELKRSFLGPINREWGVYLAALVSLPLIWLVVQRNEVVGYALMAGSIVVLGYIAVFMMRECTPVERSRMLLALILIAASVVFWTLFEQAGSSLNLFADRNTQLPNNGFWTVTASQTQSFNSAFILILAPMFASLWVALAKKNLDPNPSLKFGLALVQVGLSFLVLVFGAQFADDSFRIPLIFLALAYLVQTFGELMLSPVGLSMITKLSAPKVVATMMAVWFLSSSAAQFLGGFLAGMTETETVAGQVLDPGKALATYVEVYGLFGWITIGIGAAFCLISPFLNRLAHGVK
jgi:proton-dependent oligopeptide transporter, POT family